MFTDTEEDQLEDTDSFHPIKAYMIGLMDRIVDLTSGTQFAAILQASELYWDTTAGINRMDASCRVIFPMAFAIINAIYWPLYMYIL